MHLAQHPSGTAAPGAPGAATTRWRRIAGAIGLCVAAVVLALPATVAAGDKALGRAGPVRMGDRYADLQRQARWTVDANTSLDDCLMVTGGVQAPGVSMMVDGGVVVRFDIESPTGIGPFGLRIGDTHATALRKLPSPPTHVSADAAEGIPRLRWPADVAAHAPRALGLQADLDPDGRIDHLSWGRMAAVTGTACL